MTSKEDNILRANWPAPAQVKTLITQKNTLVSHTIIDDDFGFNIATHVGENLAEVNKRRDLLEKKFLLPAQPSWITQVRGSTVLCLDTEYHSEEQQADASFSFKQNTICVVTSADCIPIFLTDTQGQFVAAIHSGWQGLHENIIHACVKRIRERAQQLAVELSEIIAYIAPCISQQNYQVDEDFFQRFKNINDSYSLAFVADQDKGKYLADLKKIANLQLQAEGITNISDSGICTYQSEQFYSHRLATHQHSKKTGRFASMIWKEA